MGVFSKDDLHLADRTSWTAGVRCPVQNQLWTNNRYSGNPEALWCKSYASYRGDKKKKSWDNGYLELKKFVFIWLEIFWSVRLRLNNPIESEAGHQKVRLPLLLQFTAEGHFSRPHRRPGPLWATGSGSWELAAPCPAGHPEPSGTGWRSCPDLCRSATLSEPSNLLCLKAAAPGRKEVQNEAVNRSCREQSSSEVQPRWPSSRTQLWSFNQLGSNPKLCLPLHRWTG